MVADDILLGLVLAGDLFLLGVMLWFFALAWAVVRSGYKP